MVAMASAVSNPTGLAPQLAPAPGISFAETASLAQARFAMTATPLTVTVAIPRVRFKIQPTAVLLDRPAFALRSVATNASKLVRIAMMATR
jgi:hypothetical protein